MGFKKLLKYVLVAGLMGAIVMTPVTKAVAAVSGEEKDGPSEEERAEEARQKKVQEEVENMIKEATAPVNKTVAGVKSSVDGYYFAKKVQGVALTPSAPGTGSFVKVADTDIKKSAAAVAVANNVAASYGGAVGPCINVYYGKMAGGKFTDSTDASAGTISVGIPASFQTAGMEYSVVAIYAGGAYKIYNNTSTNPSVVTVNVEKATSPNVMYAVVKSAAGSTPVQASDATADNASAGAGNANANKASDSAATDKSTGASDTVSKSSTNNASADKSTGTSNSASTGASDKTSDKASDSASTGSSTDKTTSKTSDKASDSASTLTSR